MGKGFFRILFIIIIIIIIIITIIIITISIINYYSMIRSRCSNVIKNVPASIVVEEGYGSHISFKGVRPLILFDI